jgi:hypothetical protein
MVNYWNQPRNRMGEGERGMQNAGVSFANYEKTTLHWSLSFSMVHLKVMSHEENQGGRVDT